MEAPEQALPGNEGEPPEGAEQAHTPNQIQQSRQPTVEPPDSPQQVIESAQSKAQNQRQQKLPALDADRQLHQPKSRAKKLPVF